MRSTKQDPSKRSPHSSPETAERIRDAAIIEFAAHGFAQTTVRGIAQAAGISPGLVIHHFGSKDGLRSACDDHVFDAITEAKRTRTGLHPLAATSALLDERMHGYVDYLTKSMLDPSEHGQRYFDHYVGVLELSIEEGFAGYTFRQLEDRRAQAATLAALGLAPLMLQQRLHHVLGTASAAEMLTRLTPALFDLFTHGLIETVPGRAADVRTEGAATCESDTTKNDTPRTKAQKTKGES